MNRYVCIYMLCCSIYGCYIAVLGHKNLKQVNEKQHVLGREGCPLALEASVSKHMKNLQQNASSWLGAEPFNKGQPMFMSGGIKTCLCAN